MNNLWKFTNLQNGAERSMALYAYWEVELDPMSDDYLPDEIDAYKLFNIWKKKVENKYEGNLIPIHWSVRSEKPFELMTFQYIHFGGLPRKDFPSFFTEPINVETDEKLNWLTIPVMDKLWSEGRKCGFIQEATGWKPSVLQPFVYLPAITSALQV